MFSQKGWWQKEKSKDPILKGKTKENEEEENMKKRRLLKQGALGEQKSNKTLEFKHTFCMLNHNPLFLIILLQLTPYSLQKRCFAESI